MVWLELLFFYIVHNLGHVICGCRMVACHEGSGLGALVLRASDSLAGLYPPWLEGFSVPWPGLFGLA